MIQDRFLETLKEAGLKFHATDQTLEIRSIINVKDKSFWGICVLGMLGLLCIFLPFFKPIGLVTQIFFLLLGILFVSGSIFSLLSKCFDGLILENGVVHVRFNLWKSSVSVIGNGTVNLKTDLQKSSNALGSDYYSYTLVLEGGTKEFRLLRFVMERKNSEKAFALGVELKRILKTSINRFQ